MLSTMHEIFREVSFPVYVCMCKSIWCGGGGGGVCVGGVDGWSLNIKALHIRILSNFIFHSIGQEMKIFCTFIQFMLFVRNEILVKIRS